MDWSGRSSSARPSGSRVAPKGSAPFASIEDLSIASFDISSPVAENTYQKGKKQHSTFSIN